jgi:hypothetical protein
MITHGKRQRPRSFGKFRSAGDLYQIAAPVARFRYIAASGGMG